jgi:hypothetical protein
VGRCGVDDRGYRDSLSWRPKRIPILAILVGCLRDIVTVTAPEFSAALTWSSW